MKFFLDTGNIKEIEEAQAMGILDGVTTNPTLVSKEGKDFNSLLREICSIVDGPISAEVVSVEVKEMLAEGRALAKIHKNIVVKLPTIPEGVKAAKILVGEGIKVNMTLVFSPNQALVVGKVGAAYVSPFIGRLDDISQAGMELIRQIVTIYRNYGFKTEVLTASVRNPLHLVDAALAGSHVATMPFSVFQQLLKHPLTDIGLKKFLSDWEKGSQPKGN